MLSGLRLSDSWLLVLRLELLRTWVEDHGLRIGIIVLAAALARTLIYRLVPPAMHRALTIASFEGDVDALHKRADTLGHVLVRLADVLIALLALFFVLGEIGYNLAPIVAGLGIGGIAIGLGAQSLVKDTINGLFILGENQFRRGDFVTIANVSGTVLDVNLRRTVLRDIDGTVHSVPNSAIQVSSNHTRDYSGINLTVQLPQGADLERALTIIAEVGAALQDDLELSSNVLEAPRPARIESVDEKGVTLRILGKTRPGAAAQIAFEYRRRLKEAFDKAGLGYTVAAPPAVPDATSAAGVADPSAPSPLRASPTSRSNPPSEGSGR